MQRVGVYPVSRGREQGNIQVWLHEKAMSGVECVEPQPY